MKIKFLLTILLALFAFAAVSEVLYVPKTVAVIESGVFSDAVELSAAAIPASVLSISTDAFPSTVTTIYGVPGSAAERFARQTDRVFVAANVNILSVSHAAWTAPETPIGLSAEAESPIWPLSYRYQLEKNGEIVSESEWSDTSYAQLQAPEGGVYDVRVFVKNEWIENSRLFPASLTVGERVKFVSEPLRVNVGETVSLLSSEENRSVTLKVDKTNILSLSGTNGKGLRAGTCTLTATAKQPEGTIVTKIPVQVCVKVTGVSVLNAPETMFVGRSSALSARVLPSDATYPSVEWSSSDESVISVSENGVLTAHALGEATVTATADGVSASVSVCVAEPVSAISIRKADENAFFDSGAKISLIAEIEPPRANPRAVAWRSSDRYILTVDENGTVTCVAPGSATVFCEATDGSGVSARYDVTVLQGVSKITLTADRANILPGETARIKATVSPDSAVSKAVFWETDNPSVAVVDQNGTVTPIGAGVVTVSATARNGIYASVTLRVFESGAPSSISIGSEIVYLNVGESYALSVSVKPEGAETAADWLSSNPAIVSVDENGVLFAKTYGTATVSAVSAVDASVSASRSIVVLNPTRTLVMPARRTDKSGITQNLNKIASVKASAVNELNALKAAGKISESVYNARKNVVSSAFSMYSFPWMTLKEQVYWNVDNSEGGAKDFKPGIVYYGLPYISGTYYQQRLYNVSKAVSQNRYYKPSGSDYYVLNQDMLLGGKYCGNDCSSMTAISYFGTGMSGLGDWNTHKFYTTDEFKTLSKSAELYPGDIIVRNYRHVVIFLYYVNEEKTQFVIIEQGGNEAAINTISTSVHDTSYYFSNSYIPRRYLGWM